MRGRKRITPNGEPHRDGDKFDRLEAFAAVLPVIRARTAADLGKPGLPRQKVLATVVQLLERSLIRVGNDEYAKANNSFGLTTMRDQHVVVKGSTLRFEFRGKSGKRHSVGINDRRLARIVRQCRDLPGTGALSVRRRRRTAAGCGLRGRQHVPARDHRRRVHRKGFSHLVRHRSGGHGLREFRAADSMAQAKKTWFGDRGRGWRAGKYAVRLSQVVHPSGGHRCYMDRSDGAGADGSPLPASLRCVAAKAPVGRSRRAPHSPLHAVKRPPQQRCSTHTAREPDSPPARDPRFKFAESALVSIVARDAPYRDALVLDLIVSVSALLKDVDELVVLEVERLVARFAVWDKRHTGAGGDQADRHSVQPGGSA